MKIKYRYSLTAFLKKKNGFEKEKWMSTEQAKEEEEQRFVEEEE